MSKGKSELLCDAIVDGIQENKGRDIVVLDLREIPNTATDFFVICTGDSSTQINGIANSIVRTTRKATKEKPWHIEGKGNSEWMLIDFVSVVAHVFYKETRFHYDLEGMWSDAERTEIPN